MRQVNAVPRPGTDSYSEHIRKPPAKQHPLPLYNYHPLWGNPGAVNNPRSVNHATYIPPQREINPPNTVASTKGYDKHPILSTLNFWQAYHARKTSAWSSYDRVHNLTHDSYTPQREVRYNNIGPGVHVGGLSKNTPGVFHPLSGVVPISSVTRRP